MEVLEQPQAVGGPGAGVPAGPAAAAGGSSASALAAPTRRGPAAWLRHTILRAQAVAEDKPLAEALGEYEDEADDASDDEPGAAEPADLASFITLPEHLLEKIFGHLRGSNRKHHFAMWVLRAAGAGHGNGVSSSGCLEADSSSRAARPLLSSHRARASCWQPLPRLPPSRVSCPPPCPPTCPPTTRSPALCTAHVHTCRPAACMPVLSAAVG